MQKDTRYTIALILSLVFAIISFIIMVYFMGRTTTVFSPPQFDQSAVVGDPTELSTENIPVSWDILSEDSLPFAVGVAGLPERTEDDKLNVWLFNPKDNSAWIQLQAYDKAGNALGSSGLIKPGEYVKSISGAFADVSDVSLKILGYEPNVYYSLGSFVLNSTIAE